MLQWSSTAKSAVSSGVKMLVYGWAGVGKTVLCATAPRPVLISAESGLLSLSPSNLSRIHGEQNADVSYDIPVVQITTVAQLKQAYQYLGTPEARGYFSTICIDSLSEIGEVVLADAKSRSKDPRQAYGEMIEVMTHAIRLFRDLPGYHVVMTAKMESVRDDTGVTRFVPSMPGSKLGAQVPYFFDEVFRLGIGQHEGNKYRFIQTDQDVQYEAKDRSGALARMEPPNLSHIIRKITGV